jgi:hypothetical protein
MPDCFTLFRYRTGSGIIIFFSPIPDWLSARQSSIQALGFCETCFVYTSVGDLDPDPIGSGPFLSDPNPEILTGSRSDPLYPLTAAKFFFEFFPEIWICFSPMTTKKDCFSTIFEITSLKYFFLCGLIRPSSSGYELNTKILQYIMGNQILFSK